METIPSIAPESGFMQQYNFIILLIIIIVIILCIKFSKKKQRPVIKTSEPINEMLQEESPVKEPEPEPLLIHCPACGTEVSRYAPACLKCGHPIHSAVQAQQAPQTDHNQTIIIQQPSRQSNGAGTAGFILALISLVLSWVPGVGWIVWFLGFLLSFIGMFRTPRGLAIAGFIISIIDLIILLVFVGALATFFAFL